MSALKSLVFSVVSLLTFFSVCFTSLQLAELLSSQTPWQILRPGNVMYYRSLCALLSLNFDLNAMFCIDCSGRKDPC